MKLSQRLALLGAIAVAVVIAAGAYVTAGPASAGNSSLGGPVILGGDDLTSHGGFDGTNNVAGWLYMQRALENIEPNVTRSNDGSIAALGSSADGGGAGDAILSAATPVGLTVTYYDTGAEIEAFFAALAAGSANPAVIWIAGDDAGNDLCCEPDGPAALVANAQDISDFVSQGGGLMSHGTEYGWLFALLPDASAVDGGSSEDLYFTPEGEADLPALTVDDINAGPWHNHFEGNFGGLSVLVRSSSIDDKDGLDAAVVLGGAQVTFEEQPPVEEEEEEEPTPCIPPLVGYRCDGRPGSGSASTPTAPAPATTPTAVSTVAGATVVPAAPAATRPAGVVIAAPDTGDGSGGADGGPSVALIAIAAAGVALAGAGAGRLRAARRR